MADKKLDLSSGSDALRPVTNAKCVMAHGVGSVHNFLNEEIPLPMPVLSEGSINTSNSRYSTAKASSKTTSVVMKNPALIPYTGVEFNIYIDDLLEGLKVIVYHGYNEGVTSTTSNVSKYMSGELEDGDVFSFPINYNGIQESGAYDQTNRYYRIAFVSTSLSLTTDDIKEAIRLGYLAITYKEPSKNIVLRNQRATEIIEASKCASKPNKHRNFAFTHISDLHGNAIALLNALEYSKAINSQGLLVTGDVVVQSSYDGYDFVHEMCAKYNFPSFLTTGNHDGVGVSSAATFNSAFIGPMATAFGYTKNSASVAYYYKDLSVPKIRIIVLDCSDTSSSYRINCVGTAQLTWLSNTLNSTPSGYGVIIALHQPVGDITEASANANPSFAKFGPLDSAEITWTGASQIKSAVDSFITNGGEFIMYCAGHYHADVVGILQDTSKRQLMSLIATPNRMQDMQNDVLSLGDGIGKAQDLLNAYVIDRTRKTVRVVRIGANVCEDLSERLVEEFQYS